MLKKVAWAVLIVCSAVAYAEDKRDPQAPAPQVLSDAELDAITAGGVTVFIGNPGNAVVFNNSASRTICVNCGGAPSDVTFGFVIPPSGKFIVIPGGPLP
jgi:hypothetical protein